MSELQELKEYFIKNYYPRKEIVYRLPVSLPAAEFWPEELKLRRALATELPLRAVTGDNYWFVPTERFLAAGDALSKIARYQDTDALPVCS